MSLGASGPPPPFDVGPAVPEARPVLRRAADVYWRHTRPWFVGLLLHGSALKGGVIPGCSDIDLRLYLADGAFDEDGQLPLAVSVAIHRDLARIDPSPFQYIQCYAVPADAGRRTSSVKGLLGPTPGTYHMLAGRLPVPEATAAEVRAQVRERLAAVRPDPARAASRILQHGGGRLERTVRYVCTDVWPTLFSVLAHRAADPLAVWSWTKEEAIAALGPDDPLGTPIRDFHARVLAYYGPDPSADAGLAVIEASAEFLRAVRAWWRAVGGPAPPRVDA